MEKGRVKEERGGWGLTYDCGGLVVIVWTCYDFGETLETYGGFLGLRGGEYCYMVCTFSFRTHYIWLDLGTEG